MKRLFIRLYIPVILCAAIVTAFEKISAQKRDIENSLFWEISGNGLGKSSVIFGTYHLLNSDYLETIPKVKTAFEKADGVVVETELDSSQMMRMMFMMVMKDKKIDDLLSKEDYSLVSKEVKEATGMPMDMVAQLKPTFITLLLSVAYNQEKNGEILKKYGGHPLDSYFASAARKQKKPVSTFETMEEQIRIIFDHDPVEKQAEQLVELVKTKDDIINVQADLLTYYFNQDLSGLAKLYKKYEKQFGDTSYLLDDRNLKWMDKFPEFLQKGNQFIAVGALHFTGNKGLIKLLRERGYTVKPLIVK